MARITKPAETIDPTTPEITVSVEDVISYDLTSTKKNLLKEIEYLSELVADLRTTTINSPGLAAAKAKFVSHTAADVLVEAQKLTTLADLTKTR